MTTSVVQTVLRNLNPGFGAITAFLLSFRCPCGAAGNFVGDEAYRHRPYPRVTMLTSENMAGHSRPAGVTHTARRRPRGPGPHSGTEETREPGPGSENGALLLQADDVVPVEAQVEQDRLGVLSVFGRAVNSAGASSNCTGLATSVKALPSSATTSER